MNFLLLSLQGYLLRLNNQPYGDLLSANCQSTTVTDIAPGQLIKATLTAVTNDLLQEPQVNSSQFSSPTLDALDSGVESSSSCKRESRGRGTQSACSTGPPLVIHYNCLVRKVKHIRLKKITCFSAWITWTLEETADQFRGCTRVEPDCFRVSCCKNGEHVICEKTTAGQPFICNIKLPHCASV